MSALDAGSCREIADRLGLAKSKGRWRGRCPVCDYPTTFTLAASRDGRPLPYCHNGCESADLLRHLTVPGHVRGERDDDIALAEQAARAAANRERAMALWRGSEPVPGTHAATYLAHRALRHLADCSDLRFRGDTPHPEVGRHPALIALVRDSNGEPLGIWRTYLRPDGTGKADIEPSRAGLGPVWGCAVRLGPLAAEMAVGEGIETAASAGVLTGLSAWAALSAGNLARGLVLPANVRGVVIAVDRDGPGEKATAEATRRWRAEGRRIRWLRPDLPRQDANDVLRERSGGSEHNPKMGEVIHA